MWETFVCHRCQYLIASSESRVSSRLSRTLLMEASTRYAVTMCFLNERGGRLTKPSVRCSQLCRRKHFISSISLPQFHRRHCHNNKSNDSWKQHIGFFFRNKLSTCCYLFVCRCGSPNCGRPAGPAPCWSNIGVEIGG